MGILDTLLGNDAKKAAEAAAADTYAKQTAAANAAKAYATTVPGQYNQVSQAYDPWTSAGTSALDMYRGGLGLGGPVDRNQFNSAYMGLPGYQSGLDTGLQAAERGLNAGGGLNSGAALKALYRYGSDYENQRAGDYLTRLGGLAGQGLTATGAKANTQTTGLNAANQFQGQGLGFQYGSAPTIGQGQVAGAQAQQQGIGNLANVAAFLGGQALGAFGGKPPSWGNAGASSPYVNTQGSFPSFLSFG